MAHGEKTVENVVQRIQEMDQVRKELDEYKRIANTDCADAAFQSPRLRRSPGRRSSTTSMARPVTALVLADIDHFKKINDSYGHPVGDKILATVASVIRANVRRDVFVARTGGEEFALILEGNTQEEVMAICERIRRALEATPFKNSRTRINYGPITISLGVCMASEADDPGELYSKTDIALYCAKNAGRNCSYPLSGRHAEGFHQELADLQELISELTNRRRHFLKRRRMLLTTSSWRLAPAIHDRRSPDRNRPSPPSAACRASAGLPDRRNVSAFQSSARITARAHWK